MCGCVRHMRLAVDHRSIQLEGIAAEELMQACEVMMVSRTDILGISDRERELGRESEDGGVRCLPGNLRVGISECDGGCMIEACCWMLNARCWMLDAGGRRLDLVDGVLKWFKIFRFKTETRMSRARPFQARSD